MTDPIHVGADVSARKIAISMGATSQEQAFELPNNSTGHQGLIRRLKRTTRAVRVCLEATGFYSLDFALALQAAGIPLMVINPRKARRFAEALGKRSKTDPIDAGALREYLQRMEFEPWEPPSQIALELRAIGRRIHQHTKSLVDEKNRQHAAGLSSATRVVRNDIAVDIRHHERRIQRLEAAALHLVSSDPRLDKLFGLLLSIPGVAQRSALLLLSEICALPSDMTARQWVSHAGLDPVHVVSGTSVDKPSRISKQGNRHLRGSLYMPAHNATLFSPHIRCLYERHLENGKPKMVAKVAIMRKLLHAIYGMFKAGRSFDGNLLLGATHPAESRLTHLETAA